MLILYVKFGIRNIATNFRHEDTKDTKNQMKQAFVELRATNVKSA